MKKAIYILNLGSSDVKIIQNGKIERVYETRIGGAEIFKKLISKELTKENIILPIILTTIKTIVNQGYYDIAVFPVITDQSSIPHVEKKFKNTDTIEFAHIIKKILNQDYLKLHNINIKNQNINIRVEKFIKLESDQITNYDTAYTMICEKISFEKNNKLMAEDKFDHIFASVSGGIPAMNMGLQLSLFNNFDNSKISFYYVKEKDGEEGEAVPINVYDIFQQTVIIKSAKDLIKNNHFCAAGEMLNTIFAEKLKHVIHLINSINQRLDFNFSDSFSELEKAKKIQSAIARDKNIDLYSKELQKLIQADENELLKELYFNTPVQNR